MHPAEETGMDVAGGIGKDQPRGVGGRLFRALRFGGQWLSERLCDQRGHWLPDRPLAHAFDEAKRFVEHFVGKRPVSRPIGGVKSGGC